MLNLIAANVADIEYLCAMLSTIYPVSKELENEFKRYAIEVNLGLGDHLLEEGSICKYMYFIKSGAVMGYTHHNQKEITTYISIENEFVSSLSGLYGEMPSREGIKAIEPTVLLGVSTDILLTWYDRFFDLNFIIRKVYENYYRDAQERSHIIRVGDAKERFLYFLKTRGEAVDRLPTAILASFLDMKPQTLLKLRLELKNELSEEEIKSLLSKLENYLLVNQSFKDSKLNVAKFALANNITPKQLNSCINKNLKLNFKDFINRYRIANFKEQMLNDDNLKNLTVEAMAKFAGFSSRSSFYLALKQQEGKILN